MTDISFDFAEMDQLAAELGDVPKASQKFLRSTANVFARNVKDSWKAKLFGSDKLPALPYAVTYDVDENTVFGTEIIRAEIGFDKGRNQGPLGNVSEYGTPRNAPRGYGLAALHENEEDLVRGVSRALDDGMKAAGL